MSFLFLVLVASLFCPGLSGIRRFNKLELDNFMDGDSFLIVLLCSSISDPSCAKELQKVTTLSKEMSEHEDMVFTYADKESDAIFLARCNVQRFPVVKLFPYSDHSQSYLLNIRLPDLKKTILDIKSEYLRKKSEEGTSRESLVRNKRVPLIQADWMDISSVLKDPEKNTMLVIYDEDCSEVCRVMEKVAGVFQRDDDEIVFYKLSLDEAGPLRDRLPFPHDPTVVWYSPNNEDGRVYEGNVTLVEVVNFINKCTGLSRTIGGELMEEAGRIKEIDQVISDNILPILLKKNINYIIHIVESKVLELLLREKYINYYAAVLKEIKKAKNPDLVLIREQEFLYKVLSQSRPDNRESDELQRYLNIVSAFIEFAATRLLANEDKNEEKKALKKTKISIAPNFGRRSQGQLKEDHKWKGGRRNVFRHDEL